MNSDKMRSNISANIAVDRSVSDNDSIKHRNLLPNMKSDDTDNYQDKYRSTVRKAIMTRKQGENPSNIQQNNIYVTIDRDENANKYPCRYQLMKECNLKTRVNVFF